MKAKELLKKLKNVPSEMEVVFEFASTTGNDDFVLTIDESVIVDMNIEGQEEPEKCFSLVKREIKSQPLDINYTSSLN